MKKTMKKVTAAVLAAAMAFAAPITAAADSGATTTAADARVFYKENVTTVVVPTKLTVAFNPDGLDVVVGGSTVSDQVVSRTVAIVSEATKAKKVSVEFAVSASGDSGKIKFVAPDKVNTGTDLNVSLQLVPAATAASVVAGSGASGTQAIAVSSGSLTVEAADLSKASMTAAGSGATRNISSGTSVDFLLGEADYDYTTLNIDDSASTNQISGVLSTLNAKGKTAFKLSGSLNSNADWYNVGTNAKINIVPKYTIADATADEQKADSIESGADTLLKASAAAAATDDYKMTVASGVASYTFANAPTGTLTAAVVDGESKAGAVSNGNIAYADGVVTIKAAAVTGMGLATGNHTINLTIGGTEYTLTIEN